MGSTNSYLDKAYYVESDDDTMLIAVKLSIVEGVLRWYDTVHERMIVEPVVELLTDSEFTVTDENGNTHKFIALTASLYDGKIKEKVGSISFKAFREQWDF